MSRCDDYCCNGGCNQGRSCPARTTPAHPQAERSELPNPAGPLSDKADGPSVALALAATLVAWLLAVVVAPFLAGWWHP